MKRIDLYFLMLATLLLIAGVVLGIVMGVRADFQLAPVHAHINLVGWASLALFGLVYRSYPQLAQHKLALFHFILSATAAVLFPIGIALSLLRHAPGLAIMASLLWLAGTLLFLVQLAGLFGRRAEEAPLAAAE